MAEKRVVPRHIAIIMDGNGRWAAERGLPRTAGHRAGIKRVSELIKAADKMGVGVVTFFAFSTENWSRPKGEVNMLMRLLDSFLMRRVKELHKNNIRFKWIGSASLLPEKLRKSLRQAESLTRANTGLTVALALNYGARQEIAEAAKKMAVLVAEGKVVAEDIDAETFGEHLYTAGLPDPDLLIRTSGVMRLSNFLLWQLSYAELFFAQKYWPDFKTADLKEAIEAYRGRERRFGGIDARQKDN